MKETVLGRDDPKFITYVTEIVKVFNQVGMNKMNLGKHKLSLEIFKSLVRFLSSQELKREDGAHGKPQIITMLILTLNNLGCCYKR
jgi:hypothetical protein